jgi:hypothetical protein
MDDDVEEYNSNYKPYTFKTVRCFTVLRINDNASALVKACEFMGQFFGDFATNGKNKSNFAYLRPSIRSTNSGIRRRRTTMASQRCVTSIPCVCFGFNKDMTSSHIHLLKMLDFKGVKWTYKEEKQMDGPTR